MPERARSDSVPLLRAIPGPSWILLGVMGVEGLSDGSSAPLQALKSCEELPLSGKIYRMARLLVGGVHLCSSYSLIQWNLVFEGHLVGRLNRYLTAQRGAEFCS